VQWSLFYGWVIVVVCVLSKIAKIQGQNNIMAYTVPHLQEELELSNGELGALFSAATVSASSVQPLFGRGLDRLGARICIPVALMCLCLVLFCFSEVRRPSQVPVKYLEVVALFFFLRALSMGALEIFSSACVQKWFVRRRGRALAVVATLTQFGNAAGGEVISELVLAAGWRTAARGGSLVNLALVPVAALLLRRSPEACGLAPDGDRARAVLPVEDPSMKPAAATKEGSAEEVPPLPAGVAPLFLFVFFYALMFGGCDFDMVGMVAEAEGKAASVNVAMHIFVPMAIVGAIFTPLIGELMDRSTRGPAYALLLLGFDGLLTCFVTNLLCFITTPTLGLLYGCLRGLANAIFQTMCSSGMAFAALGVPRDHIGRILGMNQFATLAGTGVGPLLYGTAKDMLGNFRLSLQLSSLPPLFFGLCFIARSITAAHADAPGVQRVAEPAQESTTGGEVSPVFGKSLDEAPQPSAATGGASPNASTPKVSDCLLAGPQAAAPPSPQAV